MTTEEIRGELARLAGWNKPGTPCAKTGSDLLDALNSTITRGCWWKSKGDGTLETIHPHPYPPTIDGANAAVLDAGWGWQRVGNYWIGNSAGSFEDRVTFLDTGDPVHDLYALALKCVQANGSKP